MTLEQFEEIKEFIIAHKDVYDMEDDEYREYLIENGDYGELQLLEANPAHRRMINQLQSSFESHTHSSWLTQLYEIAHLYKAGEDPYDKYISQFIAYAEENIPDYKSRPILEIAGGPIPVIASKLARKLGVPVTFLDRGGINTEEFPYIDYRPTISFDRPNMKVVRSNEFVQATERVKGPEIHLVKGKSNGIVTFYKTTVPPDTYDFDAGESRASKIDSALLVDRPIIIAYNPDSLLTFVRDTILDSGLPSFVIFSPTNSYSETGIYRDKLVEKRLNPTEISYIDPFERTSSGQVVVNHGIATPGRHR